MPKVLSRLAAILAAACLLFTSWTLVTPERAAAAEPGYLMLHFTDDAPGQKLWLSHSTDGLHWNDLNGGGTVLRSTAGTRGVRDPALWTKFRDRNEWALYIDYLNPNGSREYRPIRTTNPFNVGTYQL